MVDTLLHTIPQVAEILTCSRPHVYALIDSGRLGSVDISTPGSGRTKLRVRHEDLLSFLGISGTNGNGPTPQETSGMPGHNHDLTKGV
jgi:excisionase family DNA binding protein